MAWRKCFHPANQNIARPLYSVIGGSLSEPHIDELNDISYYYYGTSVVSKPDPPSTALDVIKITSTRKKGLETLARFL